MTLLAATLLILAGACWFAAVTHFIAGLRRSFNPIHLSFALFAFAAGAHSLAYVWLHHALDAAQYMEAARWGILAGALSAAILPWFTRFYTGVGGVAIPTTISLIYCACAIANMILPYGLFFTRPPALTQFQLPWGEIATVHVRAGANPRLALFWVMHLCTFAYMYTSAVRQYRRGQRRHALALLVSTSVLVLSIVGNVLTTLANLSSPYLAAFGFMALVLMMMSWISGDESFRSLVAQAAEGIFIADRNGRYVEVNAAGCDMLGWTRQELGCMSVLDIVAPVDRFEVEHHRETLLKGAVVRGTWLFLRKDGTTFAGELSARLLSDGRTLGLLRDTTETQRLMRSLEDRVVARTAEYAELNRQLESFAYSVSHDLRAPVRAIGGFTAVLLNDHAEKLDAEARRHLTRVHAAAGHMNELIEGLLQLAHVSHQSLQNEQIDLSKLAQDVIQKLREREPARSMQIICSPSLPVRGDRRLLTIALENLLDNAWKYTSRSSEPRVEFGCNYDGERSTYFVKDNGAGFDMQFAEHLFEPFQRLHSATEFAGTGIGLATVARIVERHSGKIWAQAVPGKGATFYFTLPAKTSEREPTADGRPITRRLSAS
jgi:PAS domain S-box-containing protein